jgi:hypothetical protein
MTNLIAKTWERRWAFAPVVLLLAGVGGLATVASIASDDPSFALEPRYYEKAVHWDEQQLEKAASARLGWRLEAEVSLVDAKGAELSTRVSAADGSPLSGARVEADAFPNARANEIRTVRLEERAPGEYVARLERARPGLWEFRFAVENGADKYATVVRADVPRSSP